MGGMTDSPPKAEFAQVTIAGRDITVRKPTDGQFVMIRRAMKVGEAMVSQVTAMQEAQETDEDKIAPLYGKGLDAVSDMLDMIERLVVSLDDRAFLTEQLKEGVIDLPDFLVITAAFEKKEPKKNAAKAKLVK